MQLFSSEERRSTLAASFVSHSGAFCACNHIGLLWLCFIKCFLPGGITGLLRLKASEDLALESLRSEQVRLLVVSAATRPPLAARCSPAFRSSTDSRCSSSRCCTRNSYNPCYTTVTAALGLEVDTRVGLTRPRRGIQKDRARQRALKVVSRTLCRKRLRFRHLEDHYHPVRASSRNLHRSSNQRSPSRFLHIQNPSHPSRRKTSVFQWPATQTRAARMITHPYLYR